MTPSRPAPAWPRRRLAPMLGLVAALVLAACGQKSGVHVAAGNGGAAGAGNGAAVSAGDQGAPAAGTPGAAATGGAGAAGTGGAGAAGAGAGGGAAPAGGAAGGGATAAGAGAGGAGAAASATGAGDSTGVSNDTIAIGIHAPATGAGAPAPSFDQGKDKYFNFIGPTINGRTAKVFFEDDGYNPSQAVAACKKLVQVDHVFMLVGGGGTDQIVACAQYAASVGVPYVAEGVTEAGVNTLKSYFAESMSYKTQGTLLAQYIKRQGFSQVEMIRGNTQNFEDAHSGFITAAKSVGLQVARDDAVPKDADAQTMSSEAAQMCTLDARAGKVAVYPLMSPKLFINLAGAAAGQQCYPRYAGIGITLGLNVVAQALCPTGALKNGASFFSPFQGLDAVDQVDPDFHKAYPNGDDIGFALWGAEKLLTAQLKAAGRNLTRQGFVAAVQGKSFNTGVYPAVDFSQGHFGGTAVHVLKADCGRSQYVTEAQNARSF